MKESEIKILQEQYDTITEVLNTQKNAQTILKNTAKKAGLRLKGGKFVADEKVYGIFYDLAYYSHFDGHASGTVDDYAEGAVESNESAFNVVKKAIETGNCGDEEELYNALENVPFDECGYLEIPDNTWSQDEQDDFLSMFNIVNSTTIEWTYKGSQDQGEYYDGSGFVIRLSTQSEISSVKNKTWTENN